MLVVGYLLAKFEIEIFIRKQILTCYILFDIGTYLKKIERISLKKICIIGLISSAFLLSFNAYGQIEISKNIYTDPLFFILCSMCGFFATYFISSLINKINILKRIFGFIGSHTMSILILHFIAFKFISFLIILFKGDSINMLGMFPVTYKGGYVFILYTIFGIIISLLLDWFYKYIKKKVGFWDE